jgi:hypothetical protein
MSNYEEGMALLEEKFGNFKDNCLALATIARNPNGEGKPRPVVRDVDAYYEDGVFYVVTWGESNKMQQIAQNNECAVAVCHEWFNGNAVGENLGWVLKPENAEIREKIRKAFINWYDAVNKEDDQNCVFLAIRMTSGIINLNHFEKVYNMDFVNKTVKMSGRSV